jgi:hypothetical protein
MNPIRSLIEKVLFAGLKPGGKLVAEKRSGPLAGIRDWIDRFVNGGRPKDPLYLSNRSWGERLRLGIVVAVPCLLVGGVMSLFIAGVFRPKPAPPKELTAAELMAKILPNMDESIDFKLSKDASVESVSVSREGPRRVFGAVRNTTDRVVSVEMELRFTDQYVSNIGSQVFVVDKVPANGTTNFSFPLNIENAVYAVVHRVQTLN